MLLLQFLLFCIDHSLLNARESPPASHNSFQMCVLNLHFRASERGDDEDKQTDSRTIRTDSLRNAQTKVYASFDVPYGSFTIPVAVEGGVPLPEGLCTVWGANPNWHLIGNNARNFKVLEERLGNLFEVKCCQIDRFGRFFTIRLII